MPLSSIMLFAAVYGVAVASPGPGVFALLAQSFATLFIAIRYIGAAYLAYLAWRAWTAPVEPLEGDPVRGETGMRLFLGGLALTLGDPKVVLFFLALLPTVINLERISPLGMIEVAATIVVVLSTTFAAYTPAAVRVRRFFDSVRARRAVNRGAGTVMAGAALAVATR